MLGGNALNGVLAYLAIFPLGLGVAGAALATTVSIGLNLAAVLAYVQSPSSALAIRRRHLAADRPLARGILTLGAPIFFMQVLSSLVFLVANQAAAREGAVGVAAVSAMNAVSVLLIFPPLGVAQAMQPLVAFNRGAGQVERVRALLAHVLRATTAMAVVGAVAVSLVPAFVAGLFTRDDARLVQLVTAGLPWFMVSVAVFGVQGTASHYFLAVHRPREAGLLLLGRQLLAIPLLLILPAFLGFRGICVVPMLADVPFAVLAAVLLRAEWRVLTRAAAEPAPPVAQVELP
jgi:Na+-driven multidrug efflux pump